LPPFTLELVLAFLNDSSDRFTSGKIEEKYVIKFYDLLNAVAKNKTATVEVLEAIVDEMEHLSGEGLGVDFTQYMVAMAIIRHERCTKKMLDALISFGLYCRNLVLCIEIEGDDLVTLIVENPNTSIETLKRVRAYQIERFGEPEKKADDEEEMDLYDESVVDAIDRVLKERWMEVKQLENQSLYNDPDQYELF
jgi:hypothetical protein